MVEDLRDWRGHVLDLVLGTVIISHSAVVQVISALLFGQHRVHILFLRIIGLIQKQFFALSLAKWLLLHAVQEFNI